MGQYYEEYYGKSPELIQISKEFDSLLEKYRVNPKMDPLKAPETDKIQKLYCKMFGFKSFWLYWLPGTMRNGYTYLNTMMHGGSYFAAMHRRKNSGFYDRSNRVVVMVYIGAGLLSEDCGLTGDELNAIVLHEIGHNFDVASYSALNYIIEISEKDEEYIEKRQGDTTKIGNWIIQDIRNRQEGNDKLRRDEQEFDDIVRDMESDALRKYFNRGNVLTKFASCVINFLSLGPTILMAPMIQLELKENKQMEIFADSFATSYGYGPELATALDKFGDFDKLKRQLGVKERSKAYQVLDGFNQALVEIINGYVEPHGSNIERAKDCIEKLKRDAASENYPPKMKAELFNEIERLQKQVDFMIYGDPKKKRSITHKIRGISEKLFGSRFALVWKSMRRRQA